MQNKKTIGLIVGFVVVALVSFYIGTKVSNPKKVTNLPNGAMGQFGQNRNGGMRGGSSGGMINGEILSKDPQSIIVKMHDGGSKIVFYTDKTTVSKTVDGALSDLIVGKDVNVIGTQNPDGSVNAQNISLHTFPSPSATSTKN